MLHEIDSISQENYPDYISAKKREIVNYHLKNNPFYKSFIGDKSIEKWEDIPIMSKSDLQKPIKERLSKDFNLKNTYIGKTSGSSGHPFTFAKDKLCHAFTWSVIERCYGWYNISLERSKQARFYGIPYDFFGYYKERLKDFLGNRYRFPVFDLSDNVLEKHLKKIQKGNFEYIYGYTSAITLFSKFLAKKGIVLKNSCPNLRLCIITAEQLFEDDRIIMEKSFGIPIVNEYGASEIGLIAFEKNNDLVLNTIDLHVEIVGKNGKNVPSGQKGEIVITSLYNKAHPLIRYKIGDIGSIVSNESSNPKYPILKSINGRISDFAILPNNKIIPGLTFYYVAKKVIDDSGETKEFIITQTKLDTFVIDYVRETKFTEREIIAISKAMENYVEKDLILQFNQKKSLSRNKRGKLRQFTSLI
ncbi:phenylacetate--CoA ligase family protein [Zunongwangia sp.]|uniref:phenylacetate--CoA ligase family protein n=1 Tax=Zunongwangia sp. TaxID=1965325 RepID=UPI003AA8AA44